MSLQTLLDSMKWETGLIDHHIQAATLARHPVLSEPVSYLGKTGGKKLRALLIYASAQLGSSQPENLVQAATAVEILHLASLVHDDILDGSQVRRGVTTVNQQWDTKTALLTGDFLYARCFSVLHPLGSEVMTALLDTIVEMVEGELRQHACRGNLQTSPEEYLSIVKAKTASFMATCCRIGGIVGGLEPEMVSMLHVFGEKLGMAFQLRDDILDYAAPSSSWGKPRGNDLQQRLITLPLLLCLQTGDTHLHRELIRLFSTSNPSRKEVESLCEQVQASGILAHCCDWVNQYLDQTVACLQSLPPSPLLRQIADSLRLDMVQPD